MASFGDLATKNRFGGKPGTKGPAAKGAPITPILPGSSPAPTGPTNPSPLDQGYYANVAALQFKDKNDITDLQTKITQGGEDYNTTLNRLARGQVDATGKADVSANKAGLFYSGQLNKAHGDIDYDFGNQRQDATTAYNRNVGSWQQAIERIRQGEPLQMAQEAASSGGRVQDALSRNPPPQPDVERVMSGDPRTVNNSPSGTSKLASGWSIEYVNGKPSRFIPPGGK